MCFVVFNTFIIAIRYVLNFRSTLFCLPRGFAANWKTETKNGLKAFATILKYVCFAESNGAMTAANLWYSASNGRFHSERNSHVFSHLIPLFFSPFLWLCFHIFLCNFSVFISICLVHVYVKLIVIRFWIFIPFGFFILCCRSKYNTSNQQHLYSKSDFMFGSFAPPFSSKTIFWNTFFEMFSSFSHCYVIVAGEWWKEDGMECITSHFFMVVARPIVVISLLRILYYYHYFLSIFMLYSEILCVFSATHFPAHRFPLFILTFAEIPMAIVFSVAQL